MTTVDLIYFNAGGGHRAASAALEASIGRRHPRWTVRCINLFDILDPRGQFQRLTGMAPEAIYNTRLAKGWTAGLAQELKLLQAMIRLGHTALVQRLQAHWRATEPHLVVSLIPNFNRALHDSLAISLPGVPFVTVLTDLADYPPNFWIEPGTAQHVVCGSERAVAQAHAAGIDARQIHRTSGMILRPDFYEPVGPDREEGRARLGLDPARPTGIVLFGGHGSMAMLDVAQQLHDVQLILLCGHNAVLAQKLRAQACAATHTVVEFTPQVRRYMQLGDFFIGKPGPGSLSEAVHLGLPVITVRNAWTMPQERYNTDWVKEQRLGLVVPSLRRVRPAVLALLDDLAVFKANVSRIDNRAVFEIPEILAAIRGGAEMAVAARRLSASVAAANAVAAASAA